MFGEIRRSCKLVRQTMPYIGYRAAVYGIICGVVAVLLLILALIGRVFGPNAAMVLFIIALVGGGFGWRLLRDYVLYLLQAGHVALITELVVNGALPEGIRQTAWARERVLHYFKEISILALVDQLVKGIINVLNRTLFNVVNALPIPSLGGVAKVAQKIVGLSLTYVDESILAYTFKTRNENVYDAAKTGIVIYAQSWKPILKTAVGLTLLSYAFSLVATLVFLIPLGAVALAAPSVRFAMFLLALFMGFSAKWILFDPIACTATMIVFLEEAAKTPPNPEWEAKIEAVSSKFSELKQKAVARMANPPPPTPPADATPPQPPADATPQTEAPKPRDAEPEPPSAAPPATPAEAPEPRDAEPKPPAT